MLHDSDSAKTRLACDSSTRERLGKDSARLGKTRQIEETLKYTKFWAQKKLMAIIVQISL